MSARAAVAFLLAVALATVACSQSPAPPAAPAPVAAPTGKAAPGETPAEPEEDPRWLAGTWKQEEADRWLLFNPPAQVAELAGKPARLLRQGKLVLHGRYLSAVFKDGEINLQVTQDRARLEEESEPKRSYLRGAPP